MVGKRDMGETGRDLNKYIQKKDQFVRKRLDITQR